MMIPVDRDAETPLFRQIHDHFAGLIGRGVLGEGERLPATRQLAADLGVTRTTVNQAYEALQSSGLVASAVGAGTFVRRAPVEPRPAVEASFDWEAHLGARLPEPGPDGLDPAWPAPADAVNLLRPIPDPALLPLDDVRRAFKTLARELDAVALDYGSPWGYEPLRRWLARDLATHGMDRTGDRTLLVNGSQHGIDLVARALVRRGEVVVTERPGYKGALRVFAGVGARVAAVPLDEHGLDLAALEQTLARERVRLVYTTPTFQNPTGRTLPGERRRRLLALAARHRVPVLEDGCFAALRYDGTPEPALKALDADGLVIHLGTFSKVLFPGLRVGWIAAPEALAAELCRARHDMDLGSVTLAQMAIHRLLESGVIGRHLERVKRAYRERRDALVAALAAHLPDGARFTAPAGGMSLWVELPAGLWSAGVARRAAEAGVLVAPGTLFDPAGHDLDGVRLAFSTVEAGAMDRAARALARAIEQEIDARSSRPRRPSAGVPIV